MHQPHDVPSVSSLPRGAEEAEGGAGGGPGRAQLCAGAAGSGPVRDRDHQSGGHRV